MLDAIIVGQVLQKFREQKKQSQELVSGFAGIGRTHLSAIERGERKPTLDTFFKIADALGDKPSIIMAAIEEELEKNLIKQNLERGCTARKLRYKLLEMKVFPVDDEFPAVTLDSFVDGVMPKFVTEFSYTLDLSGVASKNSL